MWVPQCKSARDVVSSGSKKAALCSMWKAAYRVTRCLCVEHWSPRMTVTETCGKLYSAAHTPRDIPSCHQNGALCHVNLLTTARVFVCVSRLLMWWLWLDEYFWRHNFVMPLITWTEMAACRDIMNCAWRNLSIINGYCACGLSQKQFWFCKALKQVIFHLLGCWIS